MTTVSKMESITAEMMSPTIEGGYIEHEYRGHAWKCGGCGRVWEKRWHAESCERRGHVDKFVQKYYSGGGNVNGVYTGRVTKWTRQCLRKEAA